MALFFLNLFHYFIIISNQIFGTLGPPYTATNGKFIRRVQRVIKDQSVSFSAVKLNKGIIREAVNQLCNYCRGEKKKKKNYSHSSGTNSSNDLHLELLFYETCCMQLKSTISLKQNSELVNTQVSPPMQQFNYQGGVQTTFNIQSCASITPMLWLKLCQTEVMWIYFTTHHRNLPVQAKGRQGHQRCLNKGHVA